MSDTNCERREAIPKLVWVKNTPSVDHRWCHHGLNEIVRYQLLAAPTRSRLYTSALLQGILKLRTDNQALQSHFAQKAVRG